MRLQDSGGATNSLMRAAVDLGPLERFEDARKG
jgi:hypothetical protein